jgi:hypothetical protein
MKAGRVIKRIGGHQFIRVKVAGNLSTYFALASLGNRLKADGRKMMTFVKYDLPINLKTAINPRKTR